jgi:uncharacterized damage-inducible protein DinB
MGKLELIRAYYDYNEYANLRLLEAASELSVEELERKQGASFDSIEGNLGHVLAAQVAWHERWVAGANTQPTTRLGDIHGLDELRQTYKLSHADLRDFLAELTEERLDTVLAYRNSRGEAYERVLWELMLHVANHGSYHRGETAMMLAALGHNPGDLDYLYFEMGRGQR